MGFLRKLPHFVADLVGEKKQNGVESKQRANLALDPPK